MQRATLICRGVTHGIVYVIMLAVWVGPWIRHLDSLAVMTVKLERSIGCVEDGPR